MFGTLVLVVTLAAQAPASAQTPAAATSTDALSEAYTWFIRGLEADERDDTTTAVSAFRKASELAPQAAEIHAALAEVFARAGRTDEALREGNAAIAIDTDNRNAHRILGLTQAELSDASRDPQRATTLATDAIRHLEIVAASRLVDPNTDLTLGRLYVQVGQYEKGIETLKLFLLDHPDYPDAMVALAEGFEGAQQVPSAIEVLEALVAEEPGQVRVQTWLAELDEQTGRWSKAAEIWKALADGNARNVTYRRRQATALVNGGDLANGRQALVTITQQSPRDVSTWYLLSQIDRRAGDSARAEEDARHITEIDPADARGPLALAEAKAARGDYRGVVETLDPALRAARPDDVTSGSFARMAGTMATALQETGDTARAVSVLEDARGRDRQSSELMFDLAAAYDRAKKYDQAEQTFRQLLASEPNNADALNSFGYMLAQRGAKLDEAADLITRALAIETDNPSFLDSLGWVYFKQAKLDKARDPLQRAAAALPTTSVIQDHLGELYFQLKQYRDAAAAWDRALAGDRAGIDAAAITKKRDRAKALAGK